MNVRFLAAAGAAVVVLITAGCSSITDGRGSEPTDAPTPTASTHDFPSQSSSTAPTASPSSAGISTTTASSPASPSGPPPLRTVTVEGTTTGRRITGNIYASDRLTKCAGHAYGKPMVAFLRKYPCLHAHRVLSTVEVNGRTAVVSAVDASFRPIGQDPYAATARFVRLERANNTGSINDLLREGHSIRGIATHIPLHEVFQVIGQDNSATVLDGWYVKGTTSDNDPALTRVETDLFLTPLS